MVLFRNSSCDHICHRALFHNKTLLHIYINSFLTTDRPLETLLFFKVRFLVQMHTFANAYLLLLRWFFKYHKTKILINYFGFLPSRLCLWAKPEPENLFNVKQMATVDVAAFLKKIFN